MSPDMPDDLMEQLMEDRTDRIIIVGGDHLDLAMRREILDHIIPASTVVIVISCDHLMPRNRVEEMEDFHEVLIRLCKDLKVDDAHFQTKEGCRVKDRFSQRARHGKVAHIANVPPKRRRPFSVTRHHNN